MYTRVSWYNTLLYPIHSTIHCTQYKAPSTILVHIQYNCTQCSVHYTVPSSFTSIILILHSYIHGTCNVHSTCSKYLTGIALQRIHRYNVLFSRSRFYVMENSRTGYNVLSLQRTFFRPPLEVRYDATRLYIVTFWITLSLNDDVINDDVIFD